MKLLLRLLLACAAAPLLGAEPPVKPAPLEALPELSKPGLSLTFTSGGKSDTRHARLIALAVPAGAPATPFLPAGPFTAKWEGSILSPLRSQYTLGVEVQGSVKVTVNGTLLIEGAGNTTSQRMDKAVQLNKGANAILVEFASDSRTDAWLQMTWSSRDFAAEPVPPSALTHNANAMPLREGARLREGRLLFAQLRCTACHADPSILPPKGQGMPELDQDAPLFADLGAKFQPAWLAQWIGDPHSIRPQSLMPRIFPPAADGGPDPRARDLAAFLVSQGKPAAAPPASDEDATAGGALFANLGCVACHSVPTSQDPDAHHRIPLSHLKAKWQPAALREYLQDPAKNYPSTRMPHFRLDAREAALLGAFLLSGEQKAFAAGPAGDLAKGAQLLASSGCLNCHAGLPPTTQPTLAATLTGGWTRGCMAEQPAQHGAAPDFALRPAQRDALRAFAAAGFASLKQDSPIEFSERQIASLRCTACHGRDSQQSTWSQLDSEMATLTAGAPEQTSEAHPVSPTWTPALTWTGEKLQPSWAADFIAGKTPYKPRLYLSARMPGFASRAQGIAEGLSLAHGFLSAPAAPGPAAAVPADTLSSGATLVGENGGFNCTTCHGLGDREATAVFEAPAPNLAYARERLRKAYFDRWLLQPLRIDPETKMPRFADEDGKTPLGDFFEGKASAQFDAIWHFLGTVQKPKPAQP